MVGKLNLYKWNKLLIIMCILAMILSSYIILVPKFNVECEISTRESVKVYSFFDSNPETILYFDEKVFTDLNFGTRLNRIKKTFMGDYSFDQLMSMEANYRIDVEGFDSINELNVTFFLGKFKLLSYSLEDFEQDTSIYIKDGKFVGGIFKPTGEDVYIAFNNILWLKGFVLGTYILSVIIFIVSICGLIFCLKHNYKKIRCYFEENELISSILVELFIMMILTVIVYANIMFRYSTSSAVPNSSYSLLLLITSLYLGINLSKKISMLGSFKFDISKNNIYYLVLLVTAIFVYFFKIDSNPNYNNDEFYNINTAYGFLKTGNFVEWDFVNNVPLSPYGRGKILSFILAILIKYLGTNVIYSRGLMAICGVIFILIFYRLCLLYVEDSRLAYVLASSLLLNPRYITLFRTVRMYAVALPLALLVYYYCLRAVVNSNNFSKNNCFTAFIKDKFDYSLKDSLIVILLSILCWDLFQNVFIIIASVIIWCIYRAFRTKEDKYKSVLIISCIGIVAITLTAFIPDIFPQFLIDMKDAVLFNTKLGNYRVKYQYIWDSFWYPFGLIVGTFLTCLGILECKSQKSENNQLLLFTIGINVFLFSFVFSRYYQHRYLSYLYPLCMILIGMGIKYLLRRIRYDSIRFAILASMIVISIYHLYEAKNFIYDGDNNCAYFEKAYDNLAEYWGANRTLPLFQRQYRSLYLQSFDEVICQEYDDDDLSSWYYFAENYPNGIIGIETQKYYFNSKKMIKFVENWTNHITGTGIDDYMMETYEYNLIEPSKKDDMEDYTQLDDLISYKKSGNSLNVKVCINDDEDITTFMAIKLVSDVGEEKYVQLDLSSNQSYQNVFILSGCGNMTICDYEVIELSE